MFSALHPASLSCCVGNDKMKIKVDSAAVRKTLAFFWAAEPYAPRMDSAGFAPAAPTSLKAKVESSKARFCCARVVLFFATRKTQKLSFCCTAELRARVYSLVLIVNIKW